MNSLLEIDRIRYRDAYNCENVHIRYLGAVYMEGETSWQHWGRYSFRLLGEGSLPSISWSPYIREVNELLVKPLPGFQAQ